MRAKERWFGDKDAIVGIFNAFHHVAGAAGWGVDDGQRAGLFLFHRQ